MNIESYVNSGTIGSLHPVLISWIKTINDYMDYFDIPDSPWWYNERATLSLFAAAVWKAKGIALEEYATIKGKKNDSWAGRCDLFIGLPSYQFACEAKQAWCPIGRTAQKGTENARKGLIDACKDARKLEKTEGRRLGICFAVPYLPKRDSEILEEQLENWLKYIRGLECSSIAWTFPQKTRRKIVTEEGYYFPGVVAIIKEIFRQV
ncbi:MAG: hypothetical protein D3923_09575 [Candidatus Electrothrix sp. AR3]|nr:hypothetical protein [Candidatus Electrothrix sp. AR3]